MIEEYLHSRRRRFEAEGFECLQDVAYGGYHFAFVAAKTRFTFVSIVPMFLREVFVFAPFPALTVAELQQFAMTCFDFARFQLRTKPLGQRLLGDTISVYAVALLPAADDQLQEHVREHAPRSVPGGGWPIPVIYDARLNLLHHFQKVPLIGNAFYWKFKKVLKQRLSPDAPAPPPPHLPQKPMPPQRAMTEAPAARGRRQWLRLPSLRSIAGSGTLPAAINAERARRFIERLRQQQSLGRALSLGLPTAAVMGFIWGVVNGMSGVPLEWLPLVGIGYVIGTCVRAAGKGIDRRFGVAGAVLTLLGCLVSRLFALSIAVAFQVPGLGNFFLLQEVKIGVILQLLMDNTDVYNVAALAASVCQGYFFAFNRITLQEMSYLADEGPPK
jgi:hypothetical protein